MDVMPISQLRCLTSPVGTHIEGGRTGFLKKRRIVGQKKEETS